MDRPEDRLARAAEQLAQGRSVVRAVIVGAWGSTPREVGADMLVDEHGALLGTVGGGCGEAEVYDLAQHLLTPGTSEQAYLYHVDLTENPEDGGEKVCGGRFDVLLYRLDPRQHGEMVAQASRRLVDGEEFSWRITTGSEGPGGWRSGRFQQSLAVELSTGPATPLGAHWDHDEAGDHRFCEPLGQRYRLVIVGAGHIARPLCRMAAEVGYRVVVLDDRPEYAREELFPDASLVVAGDYQSELPALAAAPNTSVVLVTRGHKHDQDCLRLMAGERLDYLGMIGSQRRIEAVYADLVAEGVSLQALRSVFAPIGLEIGAQTPAEIAVSILAQMIKVRRDSSSTARQAEDRKRHQRSLRESP